jgi:hypothetical protein
MYANIHSSLRRGAGFGPTPPVTNEGQLMKVKVVLVLVEGWAMGGLLGLFKAWDFFRVMGFFG